MLRWWSDSSSRSFDRSSSAEDARLSLRRCWCCCCSVRTNSWLNAGSPPAPPAASTLKLRSSAPAEDMWKSMELSCCPAARDDDGMEGGGMRDGVANTGTRDGVAATLLFPPTLPFLCPAPHASDKSCSCAVKCARRSLTRAVVAVRGAGAEDEANGERACCSDAMTASVV
jgi:hypothetical protein